MNRFLAMSLLVAGLAACPSSFADDEPKWPVDLKHALQDWEKDGAKRVAAADIDALFVQPDARVNGYRKVLLGRVDVKLSKQFRDRQQTTMKTTTFSPKAVANETATVLREELTSQLLAHGYELTETPGEDVVRVDVGVVDLWVFTEDSDNRPGTSLASSVGHMGAAVTLSDSTSGALILHAFDGAEGPGETVHGNRLSRSSRAWLHQAFSDWAMVLCKGLDLSNGKPTSES